MKTINKILKELDLKPIKYEKNGKALIVTTKDRKIVVKKTNKEVYDYLKYRNFDYYPDIIRLDDYLITNYEEEIKIPDEQKILDLIDLVSLMHSKTTYYENVHEFDIKKIYEEMTDNLNYLKKYYDDLMDKAESLEYMSPKEYYLARNISLIYLTLNNLKNNLDNWYKISKLKTSNRLTIVHNDLRLEHFINNKLISFEKADINLPVFDLYKLYKQTYNDYDWVELYKRYTSNYPLKEDEQELFLILILLPHKIEFNDDEYHNTLKVTKEIIYLNKTLEFVDKITKK